MAVFKQELNWSAYQNKQLKVLESLDKSFGDSLRISQQLASSMSKMELAIENMSRASEATAKNVASITKDLTGKAEEFTRQMDKAGTTVNAAAASFKSSAENSGKQMKDTGDQLASSGSKFMTVLAGAGNFLMKHMGTIGRAADEFSTISNQMIMLSGMSGATVREFRSEIVSIVSDLNKETGYLYSPTESYRQIVAATQGITSNLEAIEEMAKPLLLTQETLDVGINTVADLFNKFYTRYSFSSTNMEDALNEIRGNTAGNSANAEATLQNIQALEKWISYSAGNDNAKREEMLETISHYTSWLESMDINSAPYTQYLNAIAYGDYSSHPELANILTRGGIKDTATATDMAKAGQFEELTKALMNGIYSAFNTIDGSYAMGAALDNLGLDRDTAMDAWNTMNSANYVSLEEFLSKSKYAQPTMTELAEDKYVSMADKANHWLEKIYSKLASIQEMNPLGFGFSDVALLAGILPTAIQSIKTLRGGGSALGEVASGVGATSSRGLGNILQTFGAKSAVKGQFSTFSTMGGSSIGNAAMGASDGLTKVASLGGGLGGAAMMAGGLAAGGLMTYDGVKDMLDKQNNAGTRVAAGVEAAGGLAGMGALVALGVSNPIGWVALAVGGVALLAKNIIKSATTIGETAAIEKAYEQAKKTVVNQAKDNEDTLLEVKAGLKHDEDLEKMRSKLIQSGILSESDLQKAREADIEGLKSLTEAYLKATKQFTPDYELALDKYEKSDKQYIKDLKMGLEEALQDWNDSGKLKEGSQELEATDALMYSLLKDLESQKANGVEFDKNTQKIYEEMVKAYEDGELSKKEANRILDKGAWNTVFQNANFGAEEFMRATEKMAAANETGAKIVGSVTPKEGTYYGVEEASHVLELAAKALHAPNEETAKEFLDQLKEEGYKSEKYTEIGAAAEKWGLTGYATGTNYIPHDQIALLHEGEAVVPKKYNPAANTAEMQSMADQIKATQESTTRETREYFISFVEELKEIREFLAEWKSDNIKREAASESRNRHSVGRSFIQSYLSTER